MALGSLMGGHIGNALGQGAFQGGYRYGQGIAIGSNLADYANIGLVGNPTLLPEGWGFSMVHANAVPLTFIAKLRHEIKEWHGNPLERTSPT